MSYLVRKYVRRNRARLLVGSIVALAGVAITLASISHGRARRIGEAIHDLFRLIEADHEAGPFEPMPALARDVSPSDIETALEDHRVRESVARLLADLRERTRRGDEGFELQQPMGRQCNAEPEFRFRTTAGHFDPEAWQLVIEPLDENGAGGIRLSIARGADDGDFVARLGTAAPLAAGHYKWWLQAIGGAGLGPQGSVDFEIISREQWQALCQQMPAAEDSERSLVQRAIVLLGHGLAQETLAVLAPLRSREPSCSRLQRLLTAGALARLGRLSALEQLVQR